MSVVNLGRTTKTNIVFYSTDGKGRDGYITYNNAGFWKKNIKQISLKPDYPRNKQKIFHSLFHQAAPFNYQSDGSGRDSYVIENNAGLVKPFDPLIKQKLSKFLRMNNNEYIKRKVFLTKSEKNYLNKIKRIQKHVVSRLYNDSLDKIREKNKLHMKTKSLSGFFEANYARKNFDSISPIKNYKEKEYDLNKNKNKIIDYNERFLNPQKEEGQKNLFDRILKNKKIHKNNSMKNIAYFDKRDNTGKVKLLKNLKINSNFNNLTSNNTINNSITNKKINSPKFEKVDNIKKKNAINYKAYNVAVGPEDLRMRKNIGNYINNTYYMANNTNINSLDANNTNDYNYISYDKINNYYNKNDEKKINSVEKYEEMSEDINRRIKKTNKNDSYNKFNKTQLLSYHKPFSLNNYNDFHKNYENYLKKDKY